MPWKFFNISNNKCLSLLPATSANTPPLLYSCAGYRHLEGSQHKLIIFYYINAHPKPLKLFFKRCYNICHIGDEVSFSRKQAFYLRNQRLIFFSLASLLNVQIFRHTIFL